jgi:hypothetical protein
MKFIITLFSALFIAFLTDYFIRRKKGASIKANESNEIVGSNSGEKESASRLSSKPKSRPVMRIAKFALLYLSVVLSSAILSGALGGLTVAYASPAYTIAKFAAPALVYIAFFAFLARMHSLSHSAKLMLYVYALLIFFRIVFHISTGTELSYALLHSVLPYFLLLLLSAAVFLVLKSKAKRSTG